MSKLGLGLGINSGAKTSEFEEVLEIPYNLGVPGEIAEGLVFHKTADSTEWDETTGSTGLYRIDPSTTAFTYSMEDAVTDIEALTAEGFSDWGVLEIEDSDDPGFTGLPNSYDQDNSIVDNYMLAVRFLALTPGGEWASIATWQEQKIVIAFKDLDGATLILQTTFPEGLAPAGRIAHVLTSSNWMQIPLIFAIENFAATTLGFLAAQQNPETNAYTTRVYVAAMRTNVVSWLTPVPRTGAPAAPVQVFDDPSPIPHNLQPNVLVASGDLLETSRLRETIDRYRLHTQIVDTVPPTFGNASTIAMLAPDGAIGSADDAVVSVMTRNMEVEIKVYTISQGAAVPPWGVLETGEVLSAQAQFRIFKNRDDTTGTTDSLQAYGVNINVFTADATTQDVALTIQGVDYIGKVHSFTFDISTATISSSASERSALGVSGVATINDFAFNGASDTNASIRLRTIIASLDRLVFYSNLRLPSRNIATSVKTARRIIVPTYKIGGSIAVGTDVGHLVLDQDSAGPSGNQGALVLSMEAGEAAPAETVNDFTFEFTGTVTADVTINLPSTNLTTVVPFAGRAGAINSNSEFVYINNTDQVTDFGGTVTIEIDRSSHASAAIGAELNLEISGNTISGAVGAPTITNVGDVYTYVFTISYTHQMTGDTNYSVADIARLKATVINNTNGDVVDLVFKQNSTFTGSISAAGSAPTTPTDDLEDTPPPLPRYNY